MAATISTSPPQTAAIVQADPMTGFVSAPPVTLRALVRKKLAVEQGLTGSHYLTEEGWTLRKHLLSPSPLAAQVQSPPGAAEWFAYNDGRWAPERRLDGATRGVQVSRAWEDIMLERWRAQGSRQVPCAWERQQPVAAVSWALEHARQMPAARDARGRWALSGYAVEEASAPGKARISWKVCHEWLEVGGVRRREASTLNAMEFRAIMAYSAELKKRGWRCVHHRAPYTGHLYLIASPATLWLSRKR